MAQQQPFYLEVSFSETHREMVTEQLTDVVFDPSEAHNVAADPAYGQDLVEMRVMLDSWMRQTQDPLLNGPVSAPKGVLVSDADELSLRDIWQRTPRPQGYA